MTCACSCVVISFYHWFLRHAIFQIHIIVFVKYLFTFFTYTFLCFNRLCIFNCQQTHFYYIEYVYTYHCTCFFRLKNTCCSNKSIYYQSRVSVMRNIEQNRFLSLYVSKVFIRKKFWGFSLNSKCFVFN